MKYIDAEKLITIIEERKTQQDMWMNRYHDPINQGISQELTEILSIITSLQQDKAAVGLGQGSQVLAEFMEKASEIGKKYNYGFGPNLSSLPQPEVDLKEEINDFLLNNSEFLIERDSKDVVQKLARHFYELGQLNARKEEENK